MTAPTTAHVLSSLTVAFKPSLLAIVELSPLLVRFAPLDLSPDEVLGPEDKHSNSLNLNLDLNARQLIDNGYVVFETEAPIDCVLAIDLKDALVGMGDSFRSRYIFQLNLNDRILILESPTEKVKKEIINFIKVARTWQNMFKSQVHGHDHEYVSLLKPRFLFT